MTDKEAMQMALETLEEVQMAITTSEWMNRRIEALRAALAQPEKEWVGLTDDDINDLWITAMWNTEGTRLPIPEFARAIEAKLKEKNT